ncbi:MAG: Crp/Fnr family transcriptional regulator [Peptostreptococcaceae bacterium]
MRNSFLYNSINNENIKTFIDKMPYNIKNNTIMKEIQKGRIVVLKGNEIESVYISCQGKMQVKNEFENGFVYSFANVNPIAYIGVMEIMANKQTYSSTLQATTDCIILDIPKDDFLDWIKSDQELTLEILRFVSNSMYEQSLKNGEVLAYPAICILISYLINVFESDDKETIFLEKTREEISSLLGFSVRTLNRNLKILKEDNLISVTRKGILITEEQFNQLCKELEKLK